MLPSNPVWRDHTTTRGLPQAWNDTLNWLIIFLVVVVVIGPILYLLPNARDNRLIALREQARQAGMAVQITSVPKLDPPAYERVSAGAKLLEPKRLCTAYKLPVGTKLSAVDRLLLLKKPELPTILVNEVMPGWVLYGEAGEVFWRTYAGDAVAAQQLQDTLSRLPEDALGVSIDEEFVSCYWLEKAAADSDGVTDIAKILTALRDDLVDRFAVIIC